MSQDVEITERASAGAPTDGRHGPSITRLDVSAYSIPTDYPEADGTLEWNQTTLVVVEVDAAEHRGVGFTYGDASCAHLIKGMLSDAVRGRPAMAVAGCWQEMVRAVRNIGRPGIASMAIAAVDVALWDLKARLLGLPLATLLGAVRDSVPVYGSGGFTSYSTGQLEQQLAEWVHDGFPRVKMKVGQHSQDDPKRVEAARRAIGPAPELFVDANGAYSCKQALELAERYAEWGVTWFEEPVSSDDLEGLHLIRDRAPASIDVTAGEYGYEADYFRRMLDAQSVDVLQADASRAGITGFLKAGVLCEARSMPLSAHCAPSLHVHPACAVPSLRHIEYFHDHVRIEHMLFDGALTPVEGRLRPDWSRPGLGMEFKHRDARRYAIT